jgi:hypothetical protein
MYLIILLISCILAILFITILKINNPVKQAFIFGIIFVIAFTFYIILNKHTMPTLITIKNTKKDNTKKDNTNKIKDNEYSYPNKINDWKLNSIIKKTKNKRCSICLELIDVTNNNGSDTCIYCSNSPNISLENFESELLE